MRTEFLDDPIFKIAQQLARLIKGLARLDD
jgi:hypothetical protein